MKQSSSKRKSNRMKKILLFLTILSFSNLLTAQVKVNQNAANSAINTSSAFMDASSSPLWNGTTNQGKGMLYPRVDLVNYTAMSHAGPFNASNNPNYFDGLLVFNTATGVAGIGADSVFPGYYYYRNTTTTANGGHWVSLKGIKGDDGSIGPIGPQGVQGIAGNDGAAGATGPIGANGATGSQGIQGLTGATGPTGIQGATGVAGANGSNGATGLTGATGSTGTTGANGGSGAIGSIVAWMKNFPNTPPLSSEWVECNGQTLIDASSVYNGQVIPNLNGSGGATQRFLRGSTVSGTSGGSEAHTHTLGTNSGPFISVALNAGNYTQFVNLESTLPSYYSVVWIMKIK